MSSLQCLKRAHLETNRKELAHYSKQTEAAFALGHEVGDTAIQPYRQDAVSGPGRCTAGHPSIDG
jgi:hypothetical protein